MANLLRLVACLFVLLSFNAFSSYLDIDGDGFDDCISSPELQPYQDTDGDLVPDYFDLCPNIIDDVGISAYLGSPVHIPGLGDLTLFCFDQPDLDDDRIGDNCDSDKDGDGINNISDNCLNITNTTQSDIDGDTLGDECDSDIDGDGVENNLDAFPYDFSESIDTDNDGVGNNSDLDIDGDGISNDSELAFGTNPNNASDASMHSQAVLAYITSMKKNANLSPDTDTDEDGISDALEVVLGGDPNDANDSGLLNQIKDYVVNSIGKSVPAMGGIGLLALSLSMLGLGAVRLRK